MTQKKILFTTTNGHIYGGQRVLSDCIHIAKDLSIIPILLSQTDGKFVEDMRETGVRVYIIPLKRIYYIHKLPRLLNILRKEKVDLIHTHDSTPGNILMRIAARILNIPLICHIHGKNDFGKSKIKSNISRLIDNMTARTCSKIIAVSASTKRELIAQGYDSNLISVLHNAVNINNRRQNNRNAEYAHEFRIPHGSTIIIHIGRLCEGKGQTDFIEAMAPIVREDGTVFCFLVGEDIETGGKFKERLIEMVDNYRLQEQIRFLGHRNDIETLLEYTDILVLPSYREGLPLVVLEAMKHKKPVVAYETSGIREEIENGVNGYLVRTGDRAALGVKIKELLQNQETRERMGAAGYKILQEEFNYNNYLSHLRALYNKQLKEAGERHNISEERIIPEYVEGGIYSFHIKKYKFAAEYCKGKKILDAACGVGYGSHYLGGIAESVVGIDKSQDAIEYANAIYNKDNVHYRIDDLSKRLDFDSRTFDVVCSFETIEHLMDIGAYLKEVTRILKEKGLFLLSTPYVTKTNLKPKRPYHHTEYSVNDLRKILKEYFCEIEFYGQKRKSNRLHKFLRKLDFLNIRESLNLGIFKIFSRITGNVPFAELSSDDIEITRNDFSDAICVIAVCVKR